MVVLKNCGPELLCILAELCDMCLKEFSVTYPGRLGARYTGLGTQTVAPKKGFLTFYLKIFFKHPQRKVFRYSIYII